MKKVLLILISVITLFTCNALNAPNSWIFNDYHANEYYFIQTVGGTDKDGTYELYWCETIIPETGFEIRHHVQNSYCDENYHYYLPIDNISSITLQVYFKVWYTTDNKSKPNVNWNNFVIFRWSPYQVVCCNMKYYPATGVVKVLFNGDKTTSVETIITDEQLIEYYNLNGIKIENPEHGIFIKKQGDKLNKIIL